MKNEKTYLREERSEYLNGCIEIGCLGMQLLIFYFNTITILERLDNALDKATYVHNTWHFTMQIKSFSIRNNTGTYKRLRHKCM